MRVTVSVTVDKLDNIKEYVRKEGDNMFEKRPDDPVSDYESSSSSSSSEDEDENGTLLFSMLEMVKEHKKEEIKKRLKNFNKFARQYGLDSFPKRREAAHTPFMPN